MKQQLAVNSKHTGDRRKDNRGYAESWTSEQLDGLLSEDRLRQMVADIRAGNEKVKDWLPFICPHYSAFRNNHRAQADIIPEAFTFMTCVDVDDLSKVDKAIKRALELNSEEGGDWQDMVLRIAYSARKKVHIYIKLPVGKTIEETQQAFCAELEDVPYDASCTTPERFIYLTGIDEEVYRSEHWLEAIPETELEERREAFLNRGLDVDGRPLERSDEFAMPHPAQQRRGKMDDVPQPSDLSPQPSGKQFPKEYHGIPFKDIIRKYWEVNNGGYEPTEGDRDTLTFQLASDLRHICGKSFEWLDQVIPCYDGFPLEEKRQKIKNALASKYEGMPQRLRDTLAALDGRCQMEDGRVQTSDISLQTSALSPQTSTPPEMPEKVPRLIALLTSKTPQMYRPAVAHAVFPALGTHLKEVRFLYTDNVEHEATLMNILMAGTGAGKGCIDKPIKHIMADIRRRDAENEKREREWKKDCQKKGANKDKLVRPEGLVIQIIDPDMTKPALVTRMDESEGHFVYVKLNELDLFDQLKGTTGKQHFQLMCLAFDPDSEYGQTRIGTQSVTARPRCRFNWNACTTVQKGQRYFRNVLTDGPISRINFCTIPESEIGIEQPVYGQYDAAFDEALKPYIDNLCAARGFVDCPQATRLAKKLQQECAEFARLSQDEVYWNLSFRACVIAWLKACVLYVANGCKWEKTIEDFVRWSLNYDLWCKMQFFGDAIRKANNVDETSGRRGPHNLLLDLPDVFSFEDARRVRRQQGLPDKGLRPMISNWKSRGYINQISEISFEKLRFKSGQ